MKLTYFVTDDPTPLYLVHEVGERVAKALFETRDEAIAKEIVHKVNKYDELIAQLVEDNKLLVEFSGEISALAAKTESYVLRERNKALKLERSSHDIRPEMSERGNLIIRSADNYIVLDQKAWDDLVDYRKRAMTELEQRKSKHENT